MTHQKDERDVVLVHGLWFGRWAMSFLAGRLRKAGFRCRSYGYRTTRHDLDLQAKRLFEFARAADGSLPHIVAHSLGGLVTLQMLHDHPDVPSGRIVLMGSPLGGSSVARRVSGWPAGRQLFGAAETTLIEGVRAWPQQREVGMIAGTRAFGLGTLAGGLSASGDGTVLGEESSHEGLDDRIELPVTHTSMLVSREAAHQVIAFLRKAHFTR